MTETNWEERYQTGDMPWEKGAPSPGLVDFLAAHPALPRGAVLVPGCGTGHDAREWAQHGFAVTGLDLAPSAVRLAHERTAAAGLTAEFHLGDFLGDAPDNIILPKCATSSSLSPQRGEGPRVGGVYAHTLLFDWVFEHTLFCAIDPSRRDDYVRAVLRWLKP
ncbi:MAG: methyltransferase domain-containing protein, partial [Verrucomicrobiota bacterium]